MRKVKYLTIHLLILFLIMFLHLSFIGTTKQGITDFDLRLQCLVYLIMVITLICIWLLYVRAIITAHIIIFSVMCMFFSGQVFLYAFDLEYIRFNVFELYTNKILSQGIWYTLYFLILYQFGTLLVYKNNYHLLTGENIKIDRSFRKSIKIVTWCLFIISAPGFLSNLIKNTIISIKYGYMDIYNNQMSNSSLENILASFNMFFIPSLFLLITIYRTKNQKFIFLFLIVIIIILNFLVGTRAGALVLFLSTIYLYSESIKKFSGKSIIKIFSMGVVLISLIPIISNIRDASVKNFDLFLQAISKSMEDNVIVHTLGELGGTMRVLLDVIILTKDNNNILNGSSYFDALTSFIPSPLMFGYERIGLGDWLQNFLNLDYGPGFTLVAESFFNFGILGLFMAILLGIVWGGVFSYNFRIKKYNFLVGPFLASTLYFILFTIRDQLMLFVRYEIYTVIIPFIIIIFVENIIKKETS